MKLIKYRHLIKDTRTVTFWNKAAANEFGRLAQGVGDRIDGSNTFFFIPRQAVPKGKIITYGWFVVDIRPNKSEVHRVRLTVGGNLIQYLGDVSTRSADLTTSKCRWNSTISTDCARYICLDVKKNYLGTPMDTFEYMRIPTQLISHESIEQYNVNTSGKAGAQIPHLPLGDDSSPLGEIMQYVCNLTRSTRLCVTSPSQPLINTKYKFQVTNYLQTIL
jgi:hypothetical protein